MNDKQTPVDLTDEDLGKVQGGAGGITGVGGIAGLDPSQLAGMDLETALLAVQSERANHLDQQHSEQIKEVQARSEQIAQFNEGLDVLRGTLAGLEGQGADGKVATDTKVQFDGRETTLGELASSLGVPQEALADGKLDKGELISAVDSIKGQVDALSNTQQMDMLRLQSMTNKRNEAFEMMTEFVKKMAATQSHIISNMR